MARSVIVFDPSSDRLVNFLFFVYVDVFVSDQALQLLCRQLQELVTLYDGKEVRHGVVFGGSSEVFDAVARCEAFDAEARGRSQLRRDVSHACAHYVGEAQGSSCGEGASRRVVRDL